MNDLISRQDAIDALAIYIHDVNKVMGNGYLSTSDCEDAAHSVLDELPSAELERKMGTWIVWGGMDVPENHGRHKCSECGEFALLRYEKPLRKEILSDFCPTCGAKMLEEGGEEDD